MRPREARRRTAVCNGKLRCGGPHFGSVLCDTRDRAHIDESPISRMLTINPFSVIILRVSNKCWMRSPLWIRFVVSSLSQGPIHLVLDLQKHVDTEETIDSIL